MKANEITSFESRSRIAPTSSPDDEVQEHIRRRRHSVNRAETSDLRNELRTPPISPSVIIPPSDVFPPPVVSLTMEYVREASTTARWEIIAGVACIVVFFACTALEIITASDPKSVSVLSLIKLLTKPGVTLILAWHLAEETLFLPDHELSIFTLLRSGPTVMGLLFSALGDLLLQIRSNRLLWLNLGGFAFILTHVLFTVGFLLKEKSPRRRESTKQNLWAVATLGVFGIGLVVFLVWQNCRSRPEGLRLIDSPAFLSYLMVYIVALLIMASQAISTHKTVILLGALFFVVSDTLLFVNLFALSIPGAQFLVLTSYWCGQLLITIGSLPDDVNPK